MVSQLLIVVYIAIHEVIKHKSSVDDKYLALAKYLTTGELQSIRCELSYC